jgi:hypothetical protein
LSWISIKRKQGVKFYDVFISKDWVFSCNIFSEDGLKVFCLNLFFAHWILKIQYILISMLLSARFIFQSKLFTEYFILFILYKFVLYIF